MNPYNNTQSTSTSSPFHAYRSSTYSSSSSAGQQPFSAADAYAQYEEQPATTRPTPASAAPDARTRRTSQLSYASNRDLERGRSGGSVSNAPRPQQQQQQQQRTAVESDDEDSDENEDWNVYDDFNNNNSTTNAHMPAALDAGPLRTHATTPSLYAGSDAGYYNASKSIDGLSTPGIDPRGPKRGSTLLTADAFGFDVQNADPRNPDVIAAMHQQDGSGAPLHDADSHMVLGHDPDGTGAGGAGGVHKTESGIELITVPALGAEYTKEEMSQMRRPYKRKVKAARRKEKASRWSKGDYKICGWLNPRVAVLLAFATCAILGVTLYFVIPRVPSIAFLSTDPLVAVPNGASMTTNYFPTNFSMTMDLNLRGDNTGGWIPSRASSMKVEVRELTTYKQIGEGKMNDMTFPGRSKKVFKLPVNFEYRSLNATGDPTFIAVHGACAHKYPNTPRPNLLLDVKLSMNIAGLIGEKTSSTTINTACPFELQNDQ